MRRVAAVALIAVLTPAPATAHGDGWRTNGHTKWTCLSHEESTHRWRYNGPSQHDGGLQFAPSTWRAYTGRRAPDYAWQATRRFQIRVAKRVAFHGFRDKKPQGMSAWSAWRVCR